MQRVGNAEEIRVIVKSARVFRALHHNLAAFFVLVYTVYRVGQVDALYFAVNSLKWGFPNDVRGSFLHLRSAFRIAVRCCT